MSHIHKVKNISGCQEETEGTAKVASHMLRPNLVSTVLSWNL